MTFLTEFLSWPLWGRTALVMGAILLVLLIVRIPLLKIISLFPFLLKQIFRFIYLLLEWLVSVLHRLLGGAFYRVDNGLAAFGEQIDTKLGRWYGAWHNPKSWKAYAALTVMALTLCYLFIVIPPALQIEEGGWQTKGYSGYSGEHEPWITQQRGRGQLEWRAGLWPRGKWTGDVGKGDHGFRGRGLDPAELSPAGGEHGADTIAYKRFRSG